MLETLQKEIFPDKETASKLNRDLPGTGQAQLSLRWAGDGLSRDPFHEVTCPQPSHGVTAEEVPQLPASAPEAELEYAAFKLWFLFLPRAVSSTVLPILLETAKAAHANGSL